MTKLTARTLPCPAGCGRRKNAAHLLCGPCWSRVPGYLQRPVNTTWNRYQRTRQQADLEEYLAAKEAALASIR